MTTLKLVPQKGEWNNGRHISIPSDGTKVQLGRTSDGMNIEDKRLSRNQLQVWFDKQSNELRFVRVKKEFVRLFQLGVNPTQIKKYGGELITTERNTDYTLHNGDIVTLLVEDFPLTVSISNKNEKAKEEDKMDEEKVKKRKVSELQRQDSDWVPPSAKKKKEIKGGRIHIKDKEEGSDDEEGDEIGVGGFAFKEVQGDLFSSKESLVHCVSEGKLYVIFSRRSFNEQRDREDLQREVWRFCRFEIPKSCYWRLCGFGNERWTIHLV